MDAGRLALAGAALLGARLQDSQALSGGDLSMVVRVQLADGRAAVVKSGPSPRGEAEMLDAIIASGAPAPTVLAVDDRVLVLSWVDGGDPLSGAWSDLGAVISRLHAVTGPRYGWHADFAFGDLRVDNHWCDSWPQFWAERRLLPLRSRLPAALARRVEALASDLPNRLPRHPPPALLHGDLWNGNVMARGQRIAALIDPCCYYGHAEVDVAMLQLFGSPAAEFYECYGPFESGSDERLAIYRLWPALVHLTLFGAGYRDLVHTALRGAGV